MTIIQSIFSIVFSFSLAQAAPVADMVSIAELNLGQKVGQFLVSRQSCSLAISYKLNKNKSSAVYLFTFDSPEGRNSLTMSSDIDSESNENWFLNYFKADSLDYLFEPDPVGPAGAHYRFNLDLTNTRIISLSFINIKDTCQF